MLYRYYMVKQRSVNHLNFTKHRTVIIGILAAIVAGGGSYAGYTVLRSGDSLDSDKGTATVAYVYDGDTVQMSSGEEVRLLNIDAPEKGECMYDEARGALENKVRGNRVTVVRDVTGTDAFGRFVRYVFAQTDPRADSVFLNVYLVHHGFAVYVPSKNMLYRDLFEAADRHARTSRSGIWGVCPELAAGYADREAHSETRDDVLPSDARCVIKGNISENGYGKNYFLPTCRSYGQIKISPDSGERYFCTEREAIAAGFSKSENCGAVRR